MDKRRDVHLDTRHGRDGLIPGGTYNFRVRAVGGSTGYSEWSNPVGHMSL